jgi:hypothetical protein
MELTKEKLIDALSLTKERVGVWVSGNVSLRKLNNTQKEDRHPLPTLSYENSRPQTAFGEKRAHFHAGGVGSRPMLHSHRKMGEDTESGFPREGDRIA